MCVIAVGVARVVTSSKTCSFIKTRGESRRFDIYVFATVVAKFSDNYGLSSSAYATATVSCYGP